MVGEREWRLLSSKELLLPLLLLVLLRLLPPLLPLMLLLLRVLELVLDLILLLQQGTAPMPPPRSLKVRLEA